MPREFDYQRYLASREWAIRKAAVRERAGESCERCLLGGVEATHHVTYANVGHEPLEDLLGICNRCHAYLSARSSIDPLEETIQSWMEFLYAKGDVEQGDYHRSELETYRRTQPRPESLSAWTTQWFSMPREERVPV